MKLNKIQFKKILKECIRELITEGAFNNIIKENIVNDFSGKTAVDDFISNGQETQTQFTSTEKVGIMTPNSRLKEIARIAAMEASKGDSGSANMMQKIFEDTAQTTLQRQMGAEGSGGGGGASGLYVGCVSDIKQKETQDLADLQALSAGRGVSHWAAIALGKYNKK